jgi:membrane-associated phospholipid phosphatase
MTRVMVANALGGSQHHLRSLFALAALCAVLFVAVYVVFVRTAWGQQLDDAVLAGRGHQPPDVVHGVLDLLATIDLGSLLVAGLAIAALGYRRGQVRLTVTASSVIVGAIFSAEALKRVVLTRPALLGGPDPFGMQNSLPSGHATVAMALAMALLLAVPSLSRRRMAVITGAYAIAIGSAAITAGWHRPSDVVAAYLLATVWASAAATRLVASPCSPVREPGNRHRAVALNGGSSARGIILLAIALGGLVTMLVVVGWNDLAKVQITAAYAAGLGGPAAVAVGLLTTLSRLLGSDGGHAAMPGGVGATSSLL